MATIPLLLVWLYLSWAVILFGAVVTAGLEEYNKPKIEEERYRHHNNRRKQNWNKNQKKVLQK